MDIEEEIRESGSCHEVLRRDRRYICQLEESLFEKAYSRF